MSTAYFIVLDSEEPGFDTFVDGKMLTRQIRAVNKVARSLGLKQFEDYAVQDLSDFGGPKLGPEWFDASDGKNCASRIQQYLQENPNTVKDVDAVAADLADYVNVFEEADKRGLKWHLELDF